MYLPRLQFMRLVGAGSFPFLVRSDFLFIPIFLWNFCEVLRLVADDLTTALDVRPPVVVIGHPVEDVETDGRDGIDAALDDLDDIALADEDVVAVGWPWAVALDLADADADAS